MKSASPSGIYFQGRTNLSLLLALAAFGCLLSAQPARAQPPAKPQLWISTWGTSQQIPEPQNALPPDDLRDATVRQIVHISVGGAQLRVHLSNAFGTGALHITSAHIARPLSPASPAAASPAAASSAAASPAAASSAAASPAAASPDIDPATDKPLTFAGSTAVTIPPGAEVLSDPIDFPAPALSNLAVTFHLDTPPAQETGHPGSRATTWYVHGDAVAARQSHRPQTRRPLVSALRHRRPHRTERPGRRHRRHRRPRRLHHRRARSHHQRQRPLDRRPRRPTPGHSRNPQHRRLQPGNRRQPPAHRRPRPQRPRPLRSRRPRPRRSPLAHRL